MMNQRQAGNVLRRNAPQGEHPAYINNQEASWLKGMGGAGRPTKSGLRSYMSTSNRQYEIGNKGEMNVGGWVEERLTDGGSYGDQQYVDAHQAQLQRQKDNNENSADGSGGFGLGGSGGSGSSSVRQNTQQAISEIDKPTHDFRKKVYDKAGGVMDREYEAYGGERFAGASADTTDAQEQIRLAQGTGQQAYKDAAGVGQRISGQNIDPITGQSFLTGQGVDDYMSPHTANVIGGMRDNAMRTMQMQRNQIGADSQMAGAGTGSRSAIEKAVMAGEVQRNLGQQVSGALEGSYAQAAQMKEQDMARKQQTDRYNQLATGEQGRLQLAGSQQQMAGTAAGRQAGYQDAQMLSRVGADIEGRQQNQLDADYGDFLEERDWDKNQAMFGSNVLSGAPVGTTTTSTTPQYQNQKVDRFGRIISGAGAGWLATGSPYGAVAGGVMGAMS